MLLLRGLRRLDVTWTWKWHFVSQTLKETGAKRTIPLSGARITEMLLQEASSAIPPFCDQIRDPETVIHQAYYFKKILQVCSDGLVFLPHPQRLENLSLCIVEGVLGVPDFPLVPMGLSLA